MATVYSPSSSGTHSYGGGKFRVKLKYSTSTNGITFTPTVIITDAFSSGHTITVKWKDKNGKWDSRQTSAKYKAKQTKELATRSVAAQTTQVIVKVGSKECKFSEIVYNKAPATPTSITATKNNDSSYSITVAGSGSVGVPVDTIVIQRATNTQSSWSDIGEPYTLSTSEKTGSYRITVIDEDLSEGNKYWWRAKTTNNISGDSGWVVTGGAEWTTPTTSDLSLNSVVRNSNSSCTVNWSISSVAAVSQGTITGFQILRSTNGGAFAVIDTVDATTQTTQYSYDDTTCSADNKYQYGLQAIGNGGTSFEKIISDTEITMSPAAPTSVSINRNSSDYVVIKITNNSNTATNVCIERNIDNEGWEQIAEEDYPLTSYVDEDATASDSILYRVRNKNSELSGSDMYSAYRVSNSLQVKSKPNPPTLTTPVSGSNIALDTGSINLVWRHNATDGSPQEQAQLQYKINSGSWVTVSNLGTASYYSLSLASGFNANDVVSWKVQTKGAYADYSEYSTVSTFNILTKPAITFTSPANGDVITELPVTLGWNYSDECGTLKQLTVDLVMNNEVVKTYDVPVGQGDSGVYTYSLANYLFNNNSVYGIRAYALSSTGLSSTDNISITIEYEPVSLEGGLLLVVDNDEDTGYAYVSVARDVTPDDEDVEPEPVEIAQCYLYRIHDNETILIASDLQEGDQIIDKYAPINIDYDYQLLMITAQGQVSLVTVTVYNESSYWFIYYGNNKIASAIWNPSSSVNISRPQKTQVRYSGRRYPVSYDQDAVEETFDFSTTMFDISEIAPFREMMQMGGQGIWKSGNGEVYNADFSFSYSFEKAGKYDCKLKVTRIEGEVI